MENKKKSKLSLWKILGGTLLATALTLGEGVDIGGFFINSPNHILKVWTSQDTLVDTTNSRGKWGINTQNFSPQPDTGEAIYVQDVEERAKTFDILVGSPPPYLDLRLDKHTACIKDVYDQTNLSDSLKLIHWVGSFPRETTAVDTGKNGYDRYFDVNPGFNKSQATHGAQGHFRFEKDHGDTTFFRNLEFTVDTTKIDAQRVKDTLYFTRDSFVVKQTPIWDFGVASIVAPTGSVDSGQAVTPVAWVKNYGNQASGGNARMKIGSDYSNDHSFPQIQPGETTLVSFSDWTPLIRGNNAVKCSTMVSQDTSHQNDYKTGNVVVDAFSARPVSIDSPVGAIPKSQPVNPKATFENTGNVSIDSIISELYIYTNGSQVYNSRAKTEDDSILPGAKPQLTFSQWQPDTVGAHSCSLHMTAYKGGSTKDDYLINGPRPTKVEIPDNFLPRQKEDILNPEPNRGYLERRRSRR